jgi:hypothetical protein
VSGELSAGAAAKNDWLSRAVTKKQTVTRSSRENNLSSRAAVKKQPVIQSRRRTAKDLRRVNLDLCPIRPFLDADPSPSFGGSG